MQDPTINLVQFLTQIGGAGVMAFGIIAFIKGWIVPGKEVARLQEQLDRAMDLVFAQAQLAQRAVSVAEKSSKEGKDA